jgi:hypothetical protein
VYCLTTSSRRKCVSTIAAFSPRDIKCSTNGTYEWKPHTICTNTRQIDAIIAHVKLEPWRGSSEIATELDYPSRGSVEYFLTISCINSTTLGAQISVLTFVLFGCNFSDVCTPSLLQQSVVTRSMCLHVMLCSAFTNGTPGHEIILKLSSA